VAVGFVRLFFESAFVELFETEGADKVLGVKLAEHGGDATAGNGFLAGRTRRSTHLVVMGLAVGKTLVLEKVASNKRLVTLPADEAFWVPCSVEGRDVVLCDWRVTASAFGRKSRVVAIFAVGVVLHLMVAFIPEISVALVAHKVLGMPGTIHRRHALVQYRTIACTASWREECVVVKFAIWFSISFEKVLQSQFLVAGGASEVFGMKRSPQRRDHLTHNRFLALRTNALLSRSDSLLVHVLLQISEHVV